MGTEIERKFLVINESYKTLAEGIPYRQGYLKIHPSCTIRVRTVGQKGFLTVKGLTTGVSRREFEYEIPIEDAAAMLDGFCEKPLIEKNRYIIQQDVFTWEVDEFLEENQGLVLAEVELDDERRPVDKPGWVGQEVSGDPKYFNSNLVRNPYKGWSET